MTTKYDIGDKVWVLIENYKKGGRLRIVNLTEDISNIIFLIEPVEITIREITITKDKVKYTHNYEYLEGGAHKAETSLYIKDKDIFRTKEEAVDALSKIVCKKLKQKKIYYRCCRCYCENCCNCK